MKLTVNGEEWHGEDGETVASLLRKHGLVTGQVAVAIGDTIVPAPEWQTHALHDGDDVEVITLAAGG